jgi:membrane associated rhomboid family serine protease
MNQASVGFHCPECTRTGRQKVIRGAAALARPRPVVALVLVAINVAIFLVELGSAGGAGSSDLSIEGSLIGRGWVFDNQWLQGPHPLAEEVGVALGDWWRIVTSGFLHINYFHIGFNMFLLWQLGLLLEGALGRVGFVVLYFMSLLGGSFLILVITPDQPTLGASGAVFGLMGAAFVGLRSRGIDPFSTGIGPLIVLNLILTFAIPRVSIGGHIGGLVAGAIGGWLLLDLAPRIPNGKVVAPLLCGAAGIVFFMASLYIAANPI